MAHDRHAAHSVSIKADTASAQDQSSGVGASMYRKVGVREGSLRHERGGKASSFAGGNRTVIAWTGFVFGQMELIRSSENY